MRLHHEREKSKEKEKNNKHLRKRQKQNSSKECGLKHFAVLKYEQKMIQ